MKRITIITTCLIGIFAFSFLVPSVYAESHGGMQCPYAGGDHGKKAMKAQDDLKDKVLKKAHFLLTNKEELGLSSEDLSPTDI